MDEEYLGKYEQIELDSAIRKQKPFDKPVEDHKALSDGIGRAGYEDNTYLSYNMVVGTSSGQEVVSGI